MAKRVTVIDIGSNSIRMVVYEKSSRYAFHLLHEEKSKVRISQNAYKFGGELQEVPMQRTFDALRDFMKISHSFKARKVLCVATSALRDAPNQKEFIKRVRDELKLNIKVISGEREAYFGAIACANLLPEQRNALSIDIGGGSTELSIINKKSVSHTLSLKLGTVRLKELYFDNNDIEGAIAYIDAQLADIPYKNLTTLVGIGGTFRAISSAILARESYPLERIHAYEYKKDLLNDYLALLMHAKDNDALRKLGIDSNRFDVIKPGALILQRVMQKVAIENIITSGVGVREGVYLADLLRNSKHKFPNNYNTSVKYLLDAHLTHTSFSNQLNALSKKLFDLTADYFGIERRYRYELAIAAKLYPTGGNLHFYSQNKHTYYLIQNALEYGFTHQENTLIATLTKYAKKRLPSKSHLLKYKDLLPDRDTTNALSYLLSLSINLLSHRPRNIDFEMQFKEGILEIHSQDRLYITQDAVSKLKCNHAKFEVRFYSKR